MITKIEDLNSIKEKGMDELYPSKIKIAVGMATCGLASGSQAVYDAIKAAIDEQKIDLTLAKTGCLGFCQMEPLVDVWIPGNPRLTYKNMTPEKSKELVSLISSSTINTEDLLCKFEDELLIDDVFKKYDISKSSENLKDAPSYTNIPFFNKQKKIVLRNCGFIDPDSIEEYISRNGYYSIHKALVEMTPESVIEEIKKSEIKGRGGAGFPTGNKWEFCRKADGDTKYIVCNADEGDPGAYMDRSVIEGDPHSVLEGMLIGAYAIGSSQGYVYVRSEYPLAIRRLKNAIGQARELGLLGENIFNSGFNFDVEIREGSGAFVCGEETSLIHSIEGITPEPRQRPPYPAQSGLWNCPTNINNVETWANIAVIIEKGGEWFSKIGTEGSTGTKVFSVVGKINNTGLVEVPMGITLKEIIYDIGGGIPDGKAFKAVQTGGPSGGCVPAQFIDKGVDYDQLKEIGSIMGSGGMVVMDEDTCVVDVSKFFLSFTSDESCGKCTSCREGSDALLEILTRISDGEGKEEDLDFLRELAEAVKDASLCGLGQTLPNPVLSTLKYFKDEYLAHIKDKKCPAGVCKKLVKFYIDPATCRACFVCKNNCPVHCIEGEKGIVHVIDQEKCIQCGVCFDVCPHKRLNIVKKISGEPVPEAKRNQPIVKMKNAGAVKK